MSIDKFDYQEPRCTNCNGKDFYYPEKKEVEHIPIDRIIEKVDGYFAVNDYKSAGDLLEYWKKEAGDLGDLRGELTILSELTGYYRKVGNRDGSEVIIPRIFALLDELKLKESVSGATIMLNVATNKKAFGDPISAIKIYDEVLEIYKKYLDKDDSRFGGLYNNFALSLADVGDYTLAEEYFNNALNIMGKIENGKVDCAITYCNLAVMYLSEKPLAEERADTMLDKAIACLNDDDVERNGYYAFVCEKCASAFSDCGRFLEANELKERAKNIYERA